MLRIKLVKSRYGNNVRNRATVAALGLRKMHQVVEHNDTPSIRGMIHHVKHLLEVTEVEGQAVRKQSPFERPKNRGGKAPAPVAKKAAAPKAEKAEAPVAVAEAPKAEAKPKAEKAAPKAAAKSKAAAPKAEAKPKAAKPAAKKDKSS